jgi:hypothetical protein
VKKQADAERNTQAYAVKREKQTQRRDAEQVKYVEDFVNEVRVFLHFVRPNSLRAALRASRGTTVTCLHRVNFLLHLEAEVIVGIVVVHVAARCSVVAVVVVAAAAISIAIEINR